MSPREEWVEWRVIARAVNRGEYDKASESAAESISIGIRTYEDPECLKAKERLKRILPKKS